MLWYARRTSPTAAVCVGTSTSQRCAAKTGRPHNSAARRINPRITSPRSGTAERSTPLRRECGDVCASALPHKRDSLMKGDERSPYNDKKRQLKPLLELIKTVGGALAATVR